MEAVLEKLVIVTGLLFGFLVITGAMRYRFRNRIISAFRGLPDQKRERLVGSYSRILRLYKLCLWFFPLFAIALLAAGLASNERILSLLGIINVLIFIVVIEDYLFRKKVLEKMNDTSRSG